MSTPVTKKDFSCGGIVWDPRSGKFLVIYVENLSGSRVWTFPKGHPEPNETEQQSAIREVREETGWNCAVVKKILDVNYKYTHGDITFDKTVRWFLMKPIEKVGTFDTEEVLQVKWATKEETTALITYNSDKDLLKETAILL